MVFLMNNIVSFLFSKNLKSMSLWMAFFVATGSVSLSWAGDEEDQLRGELCETLSRAHEMCEQEPAGEDSNEIKRVVSEILTSKN